MNDPQLAELRRQIDQIDAQLIDVLHKRQTVVSQIAAFKKAQRLSISHPAREENMISGRRRLAKQKQLSPEFVEDLFRLIIKQSRHVQAVDRSAGSVRGATVLIVGGKGEMGRYFTHWFEKSGHRVRWMGRDDWGRASSLCQGIDLALISVPIATTPAIVNRIAPHLPPDCVLADLTSIKKIPLQAMLDAYAGPVVGLHPLFGPTPATLDKQIVVVTPGRDDTACRWLIDLLMAWGAVVVMSDAEEHDHLMAVVQALRHFATFAFGRFLYRQHLNLNRTLEFSSPIYRLELGMVGRLFAQDPALYADIVFASPERLHLLKQYIAAFAENLEMIEHADKARFVAEFEQVAQWFAPFSDQAMRESSYLIDKLIERF